MSNHWNCRESTHADILLMIFIVSKDGEKFWRKNWSFAQLPRQHLSCLHMMKVRRLDGKWFMNVDIRCVWENARLCSATVVDEFMAFYIAHSVEQSIKKKKNHSRSTFLIWNIFEVSSWKFQSFDLKVLLLH